jgi:hypothetical protein
MHNQPYNINSCKAKNVKLSGMYQCLPLLKNERKLVFLSFMNVDPQSFDLAPLDRRCRQP